MAGKYGELAERLGISVVTATPELVVGTLPVAGNTQPAGCLNGGATAALAETLAGIGATLHGEAVSRAAVGVSLSIHHHRAVWDVPGAHVIGHAIAAHLGRRIADYRVEIHDDDGQLVASALLTCAMLEHR